jgi:hypothetical protein
MMNREIARECLTNGGRQTTEEEISKFLQRFEDGTPVMPVSFFCDFLREWQYLAAQPLPGEDPAAIAYRKERSEKTQFVFIQIMKSNLLSRTIYGGEKARTAPCPAHKGRWSGCKMIEDMECKGACASGSNVTGWLREEK